MNELSELSYSDLHVITLIGETGSLTRTAEHMHLTQPAISHRLRQIESIIGNKAVDRLGRSFVLTEEGAVLRDLFRDLVSRYGKAKDRLHELASRLQGNLVIGTSDTLGIHFLPKHVKAFTEAHPSLNLRLTSKPSRIVAREMAEGHIDVGVALTRGLDERFTHWPLRQRRDCFIVSPKSQLAKHDRLPLATICQEPMVTLDKLSQSRYFTVDWFRERNLEVRIGMELGSFEMVKKYVVMGFGFSIVPEFSVAEEVATGRLHKIEIADEVAFQWISVFVAKNKYLTRAARAFIGFLKERE